MTDYQAQVRKIVEVYIDDVFTTASREHLAEIIAAALSAAEVDGAREAESRVRDLEAGLRNILPPSHGPFGGPLVTLKAVYEDGSDGLMSHEKVARASALLSGTAAEGDGWRLTFAALRDANVARQAEWCPDQLPDLSFRGNELAGETGEACNIIKKLERERHGWRGSRATTDDLLQELADVVICADLTAIQIGADLGRAVAAKFNATSTKHNLSVSLPAPPSPPAEAGEW